MMQFVHKINRLSLFILIVLPLAVTIATVMPTSPAGAEAICYTSDPEIVGGNPTRGTCPASVPSSEDDVCYFATLLHPGISGYEQGTCPSESTDDTNSPVDAEPHYIRDDCQGDAIAAGEPEENEDGSKNPNHCGILDYLVIFINFLSALVGVVVVGSIIYGGIQYSTAGSDPQKVSAAKDRIRNAIIALLFFIFTYSLLNYLIPGGVL